MIYPAISIRQPTGSLYVWQIIFEKPRLFRAKHEAHGLAQTYREAETAAYAAYTAYLEKREAGSSTEVGKLSLISDKH